MAIEVVLLDWVVYSTQVGVPPALELPSPSSGPIKPSGCASASAEAEMEKAANSSDGPLKNFMIQSLERRKSTEHASNRVTTVIFVQPSGATLHP
jgi:hypothetical protein